MIIFLKQSSDNISGIEISQKQEICSISRDNNGKNKKKTNSDNFWELETKLEMVSP